MQTQNNEAEFDKYQGGTDTWSSLDIFLFTNGQKYSPPRKYNLRSSELHWWDSTLNYLARSQYGSKHSNIELYSIDGTKIGGPMELSNGSAYVAVEPPDTFVQSGYERYLIKATRSWEKRQEKRTSDNSLLKPVSDKINVNNEILKHADNNDSTNIQIIQDIRIKPITNTAASNVQDQTVITVKSDSVGKSKSNGVKQIPKKKPIVSQQRPSILRKSIIGPVSSLAHKGSRDSRVAKVDLTKKKQESSSKCSGAVPLNNGSLLTTKITESKLESTNKIDSRTRVIQPINLNKSSDKETPFTNTMPLKGPLINNTSENKPTDIYSQKDEILEKDIMSVSFHSDDNFQSICINANNSVKENFPITLDDAAQAVLNGTPSTVNHQPNFDPSQCALPSSTNDKVAQKNYVVSDSQTAENIIISVCPGETVKLKLNIAFENSTSSTDSRKSEAELKQPPSPLATKSELEAPGRHFLEIRSPSTRTYGGETATILTKSWQTAFTSQNIEEELNDVKLAVCRCNCCVSPEKVLPARATPVYVDNNNYFILLPSINNSEKLNSCNCAQENTKNSSEGDEQHLILTKAGSSAVEPASVKENTFPISKISECECPASESFIAKNNTSTYEYSQLSKYMESKCCTCYDTDRNASDLIFSEQYTNDPKPANDNSTQTNWNNILLEARLHKDGHYTFHMPPLDKIKI